MQKFKSAISFLVTIVTFVIANILTQRKFVDAKNEQDCNAKRASAIASELVKEGKIVGGQVECFSKGGIVPLILVIVGCIASLFTLFFLFPSKK